MLINLRNALMTGKRLPYDNEIEFLESTGTQWIDTGLLGRDGYDFEYSFRPLNPLPCGIGGEYDNNKNCYIGLVRSNGYLAYNYSNPNVIVEVQSLTLGTDYNIKAHLYSGEQYFEVNGVRGGIGSRTGSFVSDFSLYVFAINNYNQPTTNANMRLYGLKIYLNGALVRDYIPVRKGTVGYLYDRVSGKLFGNAGSGDFVLGPDVVPVEYIESHGTEYIDTGVPATGATDSEFQFKMSVAAFAFGARTAWNASAYSLNYAAGNYAFNYGNNSVVADLKTNIRIDTNWHTAKIQSGGVLSLDEWTGTAGTFSFTTNGSLILFGTRQGSSLNLTASGFKYCKIWDNSLPVRSFRPVRVGTDATSWEGAMMDVLTRRIYRNAGTGAFAYGNDLKYPIPAS